MAEEDNEVGRFATKALKFLGLGPRNTRQSYATALPGAVHHFDRVFDPDPAITIKTATGATCAFTEPVTISATKNSHDDVAFATLDPAGAKPTLVSRYPEVATGVELHRHGVRCVGSDQEPKTPLLTASDIARLSEANLRR